MPFLPNPAAGALAEVAARPIALLAAEDAARAAQGIAPVLTGAYQASIHAEATGEGAAIVADVPYAVYVEVGTSDTPAFHPLSRGAEAAGLRLG